MRKIAVLGDAESIKGFAAVGLEIDPCGDAETLIHTFRRLASSGEYAILYVTDDCMPLLDKELHRLEGQMLPAVIPLPGVKGSTGVGMQRLKDAVERAVGSDIIFNND